MENLVNKYKQKGLSLFLGAGVSINSGIPTWRVLLKRLSDLKNEKESFIQELERSGADYLGIASYLANKNERWVDNLRDALYHDFEYYERTITKENRKRFIKYIEGTNETLSSIGQLLAVKNPGKNTYRANPSIRSVFTTNYDCILQAYTYAKFEKRVLRTTERAAATFHREKISIYHMHGMLRFDNKRSKEKESPDKVILTENQYFQRFANPQNIFNYTALSHFRESSFLFLGLSMTDTNIRRLLYLSKQEILNSFREEGIKENRLNKQIEENVNKHFAVLKRNENSTINKYYETTLKNLGVNVIWIESYEEVSQIVNQLRAATNNVSYK